MSERDCITFGSTPIEYEVVRSHRRRKTVQIALDPARGILVSAPLDTPSERIRTIVTRHASWLVRRASPDILRPTPKAFISGESLSYLGRSVQLFVTSAEVKQISVQFTHWAFRITVPATISPEERSARIKQAVERWYMRQALGRLSQRVDRWAEVAGYAPAAVLIRSQRQRWGSCSAAGVLRFNWRIIMAPPTLIDYVVIHELAHLRVPNHSTAFWIEVARLAPDYKQRRAQLKELGPSLSL